MRSDPSTLINSLRVQKRIISGRRSDGRSFGQMRPLTVETGVISGVDGSARVRLGSTELLVGVRLIPTSPHPDHPDKGFIHTELTLSPIASADHRGDMSAEAAEIAMVVERGIKHSGMMDMNGLCITPGELVWGLYFDIRVLDNDGNLFDASSLGIITGLRDISLPNSGYGLGEDVRIQFGEMPLTLTFARVAGELILDPTQEEEDAGDGRLTMTLDPEGNIRAVHLGGFGHLTFEEVKRAYGLAVTSSGIIRGSLL